MNLKTMVIGYALALALVLFGKQHNPQAPRSQFRGVVDLTHSINAPSRDTAFTAWRSSTAQALESPETRIKAPSAMVPGAWEVGQIPPERLMAPLVVLDVSRKARGNQDYQIGLDDLAEWEQENGQIPLWSVVLANTGWDARWALPNRYRNADGRGILHFPGYSLDAIRFLVEARKAVGIGIDTPGVDNGASNIPEVGRYSLAHNVYNLINVSGLERTPASGAIAMVAPVKLDHGCESPVRVLALLQ
jgi:kynurenine formamidase